MEGNEERSNQTKEMMEEINKKSRQDWINDYLEDRINMIEKSLDDDDRITEDLSKLAFAFIFGATTATVAIMIMLILLKAHYGQ